MNFKAEAEYFHKRELHGMHAEDCADICAPKLARLLQNAFNQGMNHVSVDRNKVSVHGTDGCMNCDTGRITIYAGSRWCIECQNAKAEGVRKCT